MLRKEEKEQTGQERRGATVPKIGKLLAVMSRATISPTGFSPCLFIISYLYQKWFSLRGSFFFFFHWSRSLFQNRYLPFTTPKFTHIQTNSFQLQKYGEWLELKDKLVAKTMAWIQVQSQQRPNPAHHLPLSSPWAKSRFYIMSGWGWGWADSKEY